MILTERDRTTRPRFFPKGRSIEPIPLGIEVGKTRFTLEIISGTNPIERSIGVIDAIHSPTHHEKVESITSVRHLRFL